MGLEERLGVALVALTFSFVSFHLMKHLHGLNDESALKRVLKDRLSVYAYLLGLAGSGNDKTPEGAWLTVGEHKILLGALKKIEAKNGVLGAVNAAFFTVILGAMNILRDNLDDLGSSLLAFSAILLAFSIVLRVDSNNHLGQRRYLDNVMLFGGFKDKSGRMQEDLMFNLVKKEAYFASSCLSLDSLYFNI